MEGSEQRPVLFCLIPLELALKVHDPLRHHFAHDPNVEVVVERRRHERRRGEERRRRDQGPPSGERRRIRGVTGRRVGERRAALVTVGPPPLPARLRPYAEQLTFVKRIEPSSEHAEDLDTARVITRFQAGNGEAFATLYTRYFDRVYAYMRCLLEDSYEAEDGTQQVFTKVLEALPGYERRKQPFRAWLFTIVRNYAIDELRKRQRFQLEPEEEIDHLRESRAPEELQPPSLEWIADRDLLLLVEQLPPTQRQVLILRYMMDLGSGEVGEILGRSPSDVRNLHYRAVGFLRDRLGAISHGRRVSPRARLTFKQADELRYRRFALRR